MLLRGLHGFDGQVGRRFGERGEDAAGVEPTRAEFAEDVIPVEVATFELRSRGMSAVRNAHRPTDAEAALGEIEPVAHGAADAVILAPFDEIRAHAALHDEVLDEMADLIVDERGADRGFQPEAFAQSSRGVVFAAAFPGGELARRAHAPLAGIEAQHDFTERNLVVVAGGFVAERE